MAGFPRCDGRTRSPGDADLRFKLDFRASHHLPPTEALVQALTDAADYFGRYAVPVGPLLAVPAVGSAVGVVAGLRPAWRARRLDVLAAVADV